MGKQLQLHMGEACSGERQNRKYAPVVAKAAARQFKNFSRGRGKAITHLLLTGHEGTCWAAGDGACQQCRDVRARAACCWHSCWKGAHALQGGKGGGARGRGMHGCGWGQPSWRQRQHNQILQLAEK
jgi:hypothetical protein